MDDGEGATTLGWGRLLFDEWAVRQAHCWRLLQVYGVAAVATSVAPYLLPDLGKGLHLWVLAFPAFGLLLAWAVLWLFTAEYDQLRIVHNKYRELQKAAGPQYHPWEHWPRPHTPIGRLIPPVFFMVFAAASAGNAYTLYLLNCGDGACPVVAPDVSQLHDWLNRNSGDSHGR